MNVLWALVGVMAVHVVWMYNGLVRSRERLETAWSDVGVQLKHRWDLIPELVETVKAYADHEWDTLESVIRARDVRGSFPWLLVARASRTGQGPFFDLPEGERAAPRAAFE